MRSSNSSTTKPKSSMVLLYHMLSFSSFLLLSGLGACSDDGKGRDPVIGDIAGTIRSISGSQSQISGWTLALFERDQGVARVSKVGSTGAYKLKQVRKDLAQGAALLDPDFRLSAILSNKGQEDQSVYHFFQSHRQDFPTIIHAGPTMVFSDSSGINWDTAGSKDGDNDGVPDGLEVFLADVDTDTDGIDNTSDADIDGDGLPNWFDLDDDGDGLADIFDVDENGDQLANESQDIGQTFFTEGLSYISTQVVQNIDAKGQVRTSLLLLARVADDFRSWNFDVSIRGAESMFSGSKARVAKADSEQLSSVNWDYSLADDGLNNDGAADDGVYARWLDLAEGIVPLPRQMIFFRYGVKDGDEVVYHMEFPFLFPTLTVGSISGSYNAAEKTFNRAGQPFENPEGYVWVIDLFDAAGRKVYSSAAIPGSQTSYRVPEGVIDSAKSYTAQVLAMTIGRIPSQPSWIIRSASFSI